MHQKKLTLHGLALSWMERLLLYTVPVWLGKYLFINPASDYRLGEGCSHSAAILLKIEYAVRNGYMSVTSNQCSWTQCLQEKYYM